MEPFAQSYRKYRRIIAHTGGVSYDPRRLAQVYGFPPGFDGIGQTIALIELGGGYVQSDLDSYLTSLGLSPSLVNFVSVDGAQNNPSTPDSADGEVMLDLCVAGGLAPGAKLAVYMAPNTDQGFANAIKKAVTDNVSCISISWGASESNWSAQAMNTMTFAFKAAAAAGITVTAAAGDNGSGDGLPGDHVDFPASDPYVLGCGGTAMPTVNSGGRVESVWNNGTNGGATGGGVSAKYSLPTWQKSANVPGGTMRGVPDIAAVADPETGIMVMVDGQTMVMGGTSAVAPFMAAMVAVLNQALGKRLGFINPLLYAMIDGPPVFYDVTSGNNGTYMARPGYDCCTGLGTPYVDKLLAALSGGSSRTTTTRTTGTTALPPNTITLAQDLKAGTYKVG